ncbi:hypothetical protein [Paenibacillus marinisediminis]
MKKAVFFSATSILAISILVGGALGEQDFWNGAVKTSENLGYKEGVLYNRPTLDDKMAVIKSIDPNTNQGTMMLQNRADGLIKKDIAITVDGHNKVLSFDYVMKDGTAVMLDLPDHKPGTMYQLFSHPDPLKELIAYEDSKYLLDIEKGTIETLLNSISSSDGMTIEAAREKTLKVAAEIDPNYFIWWGTNPSMNPSGTKLTFYTNRNDRDETWIKDMVTGEERYLTDHIVVSDWIDDNRFIGTRSSEAFIFDTANLQEKSLGEVSSIKLFSPYIVYQSNDDSIHVMDTNSEESKVIAEEGLGRVAHTSFDAKNNMLFVVNQPDRTKPLEQLTAISLTDMKPLRAIDVPGGKFVSDLKIMDDQRLLVVLYHTESGYEESVFVNSSDF